MVHETTVTAHQLLASPLWLKWLNLVTNNVVSLCTETNKAEVSYLLWRVPDFLQVAPHHFLWSLACGKDIGRTSAY